MAKFITKQDISLGLTEVQLSQSFDHLIDMIEWSRLDSRVSSLLDRAKRNPFFNHLLVERYWIETSLHTLYQQKKVSGRLPSFDGKPHFYQAAALAAAASQVFSYLSPAGRKILTGSLRDGVTTSKGLLPVELELRTGVHFLKSGWDVAFAGLEQAERFDLLLRRGEVEVEVECKNIAADVGRRVPTSELAALGDAISAMHPMRTAAAQGITLLDVTIPGQLGKTQPSLDLLADQLRSHLAGESKESASKICHIRTRPLLVDVKTATRDEELLRALVGQELGLKNPTCLGFINPGRGALLVHIQSKRNDTVVKSIYKNLREATKKQFTKARPACLVARFIDLDVRQLHNVASQQGPTRAQSNALQLMANALFARRDYLQAVFYLSGDTQISTRSSLILGGGRVSSDSAPMYIFNSGESRFAQLFPTGL